MDLALEMVFRVSARGNYGKSENRIFQTPLVISDVNQQTCGNGTLILLSETATDLYIVAHGVSYIPMGRKRLLNARTTFSVQDEGKSGSWSRSGTGLTSLFSGQSSCRL